MTRFRQALLDELVTRMAEPGERPAPAATSRRTVRLRRSGFALAGGMLAAAAVATAVVTQTAATPAYAVTTNPDGTVTVAAHSPGDPASANRALRAAGVRVVVMSPSPESACPVGDRGTALNLSLQQTVETLKMLVPLDSGHAVRVRPDLIPGDAVVVLVPTTLPNNPTPVLMVDWYVAPGPTCVISPVRQGNAPIPAGSAKPGPANPPRVTNSPDYQYPTVPPSSPR